MRYLDCRTLSEGQKGGRLSWPYGDLVPGNYLAKVGAQLITIFVCLAVAIEGRLAAPLEIASLMQCFSA